MVSLPGSMGIEGLKVDCFAWLAIFLCAYDHPVAPRNRFAYWDGFDDSQADIPVKSRFNLFLPVDWYGYWRMVSSRLCIGINH